jgi:hypothetical protein
VTDQELKALVERLDELKRAAERIAAESKAIIEQVKGSANRNKQAAAESNWDSEGGGQTQASS